MPDHVKIELCARQLSKIELGGHDQIFNLNVGRDLMSEYGLKPQIVLTVGLSIWWLVPRSLGNDDG